MHLKTAHGVEIATKISQLHMKLEENCIILDRLRISYVLIRTYQNINLGSLRSEDQQSGRHGLRISNPSKKKKGAIRPISNCFFGDSMCQYD
jgi:hypothetical protein